MVCTIPGFMSHTERKGTNKAREFEKRMIKIPTIISAYNFGKVGTDRMDQQVACYYRNTRLRWHLKVFIHLMFICMHNAHVSYMDLHGLTVGDLPLLKFIRLVVDELKPKRAEDDAAPGTSTRKTPKRGGSHTPCTMGPKPKKDKTATPLAFCQQTPTPPEAQRPRWHCKVCHAYSSTWCAECNVVLHLNTTNSNKTCWSDFHTTDHSDSD